MYSHADKMAIVRPPECRECGRLDHLKTREWCPKHLPQRTSDIPVCSTCGKPADRMHNFGTCPLGIY